MRLLEKAGLAALVACILAGGPAAAAEGVLELPAWPSSIAKTAEGPWCGAAVSACAWPAAMGTVGARADGELD
jgi:hypothetical protein